MTRTASTPPAHVHRARRRAGLAGIIVAALIVAACSSGEDSISEPAVAETPPTTAAAPPAGPIDDRLASIDLAARTADPFDRVAVTGLEGLDTDEVALWMRGDGVEILVPVYLTEDGAELVVPFSPDDPIGGGAVEFAFGHLDGSNGPPIEFTIGPMPPSPGAWADFLDRYLAEVDIAARELGSSAAELATTDIDDVAAELVPIKLALTLYDDGTENSLVAVYDSDRLSDDDRVLLDAMTAQIGLENGFATVVEPTGLRSPRRSDDAAAATANAPASAIPTAVPTGVPIAPAQGVDCRSANVSVADAADLSDKLTTALDWEIKEGGPVEKVLNDIGTVTTIGGFIPGVGWVIGLGGAVFSGIEALHNGIAGLYPSRVTSLDARIDTEQFNEDFRVKGRWHDVTVIAESTGWSATRDVAGTVLSGLTAGASGYLGAAFDLTNLEGFIIDVDMFLGQNLAVELLDRASPTALTFCPQQWEVDVTGSPWSFATSREGLFEIEDVARNYFPADRGRHAPFEDMIRVELNFERFRNQMIWKEFFPVSVVPIRVTGPRVVEVDSPTELVEIDFVVENAHDFELEFEADRGAWVDRGPQLLPGDPITWRHTHVAAPFEEDFPYIVVARSASTFGLREDRTPPRVATVQVRLRELIVNPDPASVLTGNQLQFTATDRNGNPVEVRWSATGGTIDANGVYTAGDTPGEYTVTATDVNNPDRTTTVTVTVGDGDCVVGTWRLRTQPFLDQFMQFVPMAAEVMDVGGQYVTEFRDDGSFEGRREDWTWAVVIPDAGIATIRIDSVERGTWAIDPTADGPDELVINESSSQSTVSVTVEAAGMTMAMPGGEQEFGGAGVSGQGPFTCSSSVLTLTASSDMGTLTAELDRIG